MSRNRLFGLVAAAAVLFGAHLFASLDGSYMLPLDDPSIQYANPAIFDPVTRLQQRLDRGETKLAYDATLGYLPSVLENLKTPVSSQMLVFSENERPGVQDPSSYAAGSLLHR